MKYLRSISGGLLILLIMVILLIGHQSYLKRSIHHYTEYTNLIGYLTKTSHIGSKEIFSSDSFELELNSLGNIQHFRTRFQYGEDTDSITYMYDRGIKQYNTGSINRRSFNAYPDISSEDVFKLVCDIIENLNLLEDMTANSKVRIRLHEEYDEKIKVNTGTNPLVTTYIYDPLNQSFTTPDVNTILGTGYVHLFVHYKFSNDANFIHTYDVYANLKNININ